MSHGLAAPVGFQFPVHRTHRRLTRCLILFSLTALVLWYTDVAIAISGAEGAEGHDSPFFSPVDRMINLLTGPLARAVVIVAMVGAGAALIFQGGEMKDFIKTLLMIVVVACIMVLAVSAYRFFFGDEGETAVLPLYLLYGTYMQS